MEDLTNAIQESLPEDVSPESLPEQAEALQTQAPETAQESPSEATEPKAEITEPPLHENPRFQEVIAQKNEAKARADRMEQQLLEISGKLATPKENETDPYAGLSEDEKRFWQAVDQRAEVKARAVAKEERKGYMKEQETTRATLAMMAYKEFQTKHPDIKPNSTEEIAIADRYKRGYSLDDAYELVVGSPKRKGLEEELARVKSGNQKVKTTQKLAANLETGGLPPGSPLQSTPKETVTQFVERQMRENAVG